MRQCINKPCYPLNTCPHSATIIQNDYPTNIKYFIDEIKKSIPLLEREVENSKNVLDKDMKKVLDDLEKDVTLKGVTPKTTKPDSTATKTDSVTTSTTKGRNPGN